MRAQNAAFIALSLLAVPAAAQQAPAKDQAQAAAVSVPIEAPKATLASAADLKLPPKPADVATATPVKKRTARATTCRCGGEAPQQ